MPVYFIRVGEDGPVKIGHAENVEARHADLQIGNPIELRLLRVIDGNAWTECLLHRHYADRAIRGEWFAYCDTMLTICPPTEKQVNASAPAFLVIDRFGGPRAVAEALGIHVAQVYRWRNKGKRRPAGLVPAHYQDRLLRLAAERGIGLAAAELVLTTERAA